MGRVGELRRGSYRGEFATFVAGEFARYASRRIAAKSRGGSKPLVIRPLGFLSIVPRRRYDGETATYFVT